MHADRSDQIERAERCSCSEMKLSESIFTPLVLAGIFVRDLYLLRRVRYLSITQMSMGQRALKFILKEYISFHHAFLVCSPEAIEVLDIVDI